MVMAAASEAILAAEEKHVSRYTTIEEHVSAYNRIRAFILKQNETVEKLDCSDFWKDKVRRPDPGELTESDVEFLAKIIHVNQTK